MKKFLFFLLVSVATSAMALGQNTTTNDKEEDDASCYRKWYRIFKIRGADEVPDGEYDNVIVSFREGSHGNCYFGKVVVKKGFLKEIQIRFVDGKYEKVEFDPKDDYAIANGISDPVVAYLKNERHVLNVIFKDKLRPKGNSYDQAPDPEIDDYN